jgi:carboxyl-terminal processing protease
VSRYDDPRWYEEHETNPPSSEPPAYEEINQYPQYSTFPTFGDAAPQRQPASTPPISYQRQHHIRRILGQALALIALVVVAFLGGWFSHQFFGNSFNESDQSKEYAQLFQQAWSTVDQNYVDRKAINYKKMTYAAIDAMVKSLNDTGHTRFLPPDQVQVENQQLSGKFTGIGVYLHQDKNTKQLIITAPIPGSPAEKAGLKHNDVIIAVNGVNTTGKDIAGVSDLIHGKAGTSVDITVQRPGVAQPITFHMVRSEIQVPNVIMHYIPEGHIAHIQVVSFANDTSNQLKDAISKAKSMGATKIILDLRDNPGGYLSEAIDTTSMFVQSGNVLLEQDSKGQRSAVSVKGDPIDTTDQIVVLVNENSASAAEIVSGALQDNQRAIIIGETTFGTGTVLQQYSLSDGSAILLGTQEWLTPKGTFIRNKGITPNIKVPLAQKAVVMTPNDENSGHLTEQQILNSGDAQLAAAIKYLDQHK